MMAPVRSPSQKRMNGFTFERELFSMCVLVIVLYNYDTKFVS